VTAGGDVTIDAAGLQYRELNRKVREAVAAGVREIRLANVNGQYYIGDGIRGEVTIVVDGVPGNDLGAFMDGPTIVVRNNAQDNVGNTMNSGKIVIHGAAGDVLGYGMRGGKIFVRDDVGYRVGIHMKGYRDQVPVFVVGGKAGDFFGEYMAGGALLLLGLGPDDGRPIAGDFLGTGMHGGVMYVRGVPDPGAFGKEVGVAAIEPGDRRFLEAQVEEFCGEFGMAPGDVFAKDFVKIVPVSLRPYGNLYAY
jgi:glutamate synthase domain-containing protein 3